MLEALQTVMASKTHKLFKLQLGMTYVDLLVSMAIIFILFSTVMLIIDPLSLKKRARDNKRISNISALDRAINEYVLTQKTYPDAANTTRTSNSLPTGNSGPYSNPSDGWIDASMASYTTNLPIDPLNESPYFFSYRHTDSGYEINASLEFLTEYHTNDGGDDDTLYEVGNDLTIL